MIIEFKLNFTLEEMSDYLKTLNYEIVNYNIVEYERLYGPTYSNIEKNIKLAVKDENIESLPSYMINKLEISNVFKECISNKLKNILLND
jgi:hypothetical protein